MSLYFLIYVTLLIVIFVILLVLIQVGINRDPTHVIEPFTRKFFTQYKKTHFIGIDPSQLFGNEFELIQQLKELMPFNLDTLLINRGVNRYQLLNENRIQLTLSRSIETHQLFNRLTKQFETTPSDQIRFVCSLYSLPINILTTNMQLNELDDLRGSKMVVNVGPKDSSDYAIAMDLFLQYQIRINHDICLTYYDDRELLQHYGPEVQVVILSRTHPDPTILNLINTRTTRLVEIIKYNNGNIYRMSLEEEEFYRTHPYYSKSIIEKERLKTYYQNLAINDQIFTTHPKLPVTEYKSRFINTLCLHYHLLSNAQTPEESVYQLLLNLKLNLNLLNQLEFVDEPINSASLTDLRLPIPVHPGAQQFYRSSGLYTNISNPNCVLIDGKCDHRQLREHHLENDYGPTFDQLFNTIY
uniref:TRAP transporter solute receptor TAXI family protein n=1 Tax=viral metagenome TaxID=1070528 RepID=A0A6C0BKY3_9ZZZZ